MTNIYYSAVSTRDGLQSETSIVAVLEAIDDFTAEELIECPTVRLTKYKQRTVNAASYYDRVLEHLEDLVDEDHSHEDLDPRSTWIPVMHRNECAKLEKTLIELYCSKYESAYYNAVETIELNVFEFLLLNQVDHLDSIVAECWHSWLFHPRNTGQSA